MLIGAFAQRERTLQNPPVHNVTDLLTVKTIMEVENIQIGRLPPGLTRHPEMLYTCIWVLSKI